MFKKKDKNEKQSQTNTPPQSIGKPTTQQWVPIEDVYNNTIHRKDKVLVGAVKIQPINLNLYPDDEQVRIIKQVAEVMNGMDYNYVFYSTDRPVDLDGYLNSLEIQKTQERNLVKKRILDEDIRLAAAMAADGDALDRYFYVIHYLQPEGKFDEQVVYKRSAEIASEFSAVGLYSHVCSDQELRELLFIFFNPVQAAYEKTPEEGIKLPPIYQGVK